jgi:hypothetical protein
MSNRVEESIEAGQSAPDGGDHLNSWKEIARYLNRDIRTAQRWEAEFALPVRRPRGKRRTAVIARRSEIDDWLNAGPASVPGRNAPGAGLELIPDSERPNVVHRFSHASSQVHTNLSVLQLAFRKNMEDFIRVEVETGCTFVFVALAGGDATKRARNLRCADKAYRTAYRAFVKYGISNPNLRSDIVDRLIYLRGLLERERVFTADCFAVPENVGRGTRV